MHLIDSGGLGRAEAEVLRGMDGEGRIHYAGKLQHLLNSGEVSGFSEKECVHAGVGMTNRSPKSVWCECSFMLWVTSGRPLAWYPGGTLAELVLPLAIEFEASPPK